MAVKGSLADNTGISDQRMKELARLTLELVESLRTLLGVDPSMSEVFNNIARSGKVTEPIELLVMGHTISRVYLKLYKIV